MAKHIIVKKKRTLNKSGIIGFVFTFAVILSFVSQVFVKTNNQQLAREIQEVEIAISEVKTNNENLTAEISVLRDTNRVATIATEAGLEASENIVTIKGD